MARRGQSIKIGTDVLVDRLVKSFKLINIDCINKNR